MINWWGLASNSIWIIALALFLAVVSIAYYQSQQRGERIKTLLIKPKYTFPLNVSGLLFCLGMALTADRWWEILLWIVLMGLFSYQVWMVNKDRGQETEDRG